MADPRVSHDSELDAGALQAGTYPAGTLRGPGTITVPPTSASRRPLKVLVVSDEMEIGGSQRQISCLLRALRPEHCTPELVFFRNSSFLVDEIAAAGIKVTQLPKQGRIDPGFVARLISLLRRERYDVVHCFSFTAELWVRVALMFVPGTALITSMRDSGETLSPLQWRIKRNVCRASSAVICNSTPAARVLATKIGAGAPPIHVILNGVEIPAEASEEKRASLRAQIGAVETRPLIMFVGRLVAQKNPGLLLRALAAMPAARRPQLAMIGDGPLEGQLAEETSRLGLADDVLLLGARDDAQALMHAAEALVLPSITEGTPNVLLEAMARAVCPIASNVGGNGDLIVSGTHGLLFESDDVQALQACLRRVVDEPETIRALGAGARARMIEQNSPQALAGATFAVYQQCLRPQPRPA